MKRLNYLIRGEIIGLIIISLGLFFLPDLKAMAEENAKVVEESGSGLPESEKGKLSEMPGTPKTQPKTPEYAPGELIVKLKDGSNSDMLKELNVKYNVTSCEKVYKETADPKDTLAALENKLSSLESKDHPEWYWQLDKDSQEYKNYIAEIEKEKQELEQQIQVQEELVSHLEQRQKRAPQDSTAPNLESTYLLKTSAEADIPSMISDYTSNPAVEYAQPNYIVKIQMAPNDPLYSQQWAHQKTNIEPVWDDISQGEGVIVAVVDTGIDYKHKDLKDNIWINKAEIPDNGIDDDKNGYIDDVRGWDFCAINKRADNDSMDSNNHGTHCAGIAAAVGNNSIGVIGAAFKVKVMAVKGLSDKGEGTLTDLANCIKYATDNGADIISMSWGAKVGSSELGQALNYAYSKGLVLIAAAGNNNSSTKFYPAAYDNVIAVTATDSNDKKASFSNYGFWVDISSPGVAILSTIPGNKYIQYDGTSMACPYVAGVAGLILSKYPDDTNEGVRFRIQASADAFPLKYYLDQLGAGRVNAQKALIFVLDTTPPAIPVVIDEGDWTQSISRLSASWSSSDFESGISEYQYAIGTSQGATNVVGWTSTGTSTLVVKTGLMLINAKTYYFSVKAKNGVNLWSEIGYSDGITVKISQPPAVPSKLTGSALSFNQIKLTWRDNSNNEDGFKIERRTSSNSLFKQIGVVGCNVISIIDSGVCAKATYFYRVRAYNKAGDLGYSNTISIATPASRK